MVSGGRSVTNYLDEVWAIPSSRNLSQFLVIRRTREIFFFEEGRGNENIYPNASVAPTAFYFTLCCCRESWHCRLFEVAHSPEGTKHFILNYAGTAADSHKHTR
jgi:hypothetical protein